MNKIEEIKKLLAEAADLDKKVDLLPEYEQEESMKLIEKAKELRFKARQKMKKNNLVLYKTTDDNEFMAASCEPGDGFKHVRIAPKYLNNQEESK